jgi:hypothetical protein
VMVGTIAQTVEKSLENQRLFTYTALLAIVLL